MKKFQFAYQRVMDWRDKRAEQERIQLQVLRKAASDLARKRETVTADMQNVSATLGSGTLLTAADLSQTAAFLAALQATERAVQAQQAACASAIESQLSRCIEADRDYKLLQKFREKRLAEWQAGYNREAEQAAEEAWQSGRARAVAFNGTEKP